MSWPVYSTATAYVVAQVQTLYPTAIVHVGKSVPILEWFQSAGAHLNSYFVSYEGFSSTPNERGTGPLHSIFSIYWHGRGLDEATMHDLMYAIHANKTFTIDGRTHQARVTGGRYLLLDRGFDTYQLDIEIQ